MHSFKGVAWYAALWSVKGMVEILWRAQRLPVIIVFVDPTLLTLVSLCFLFFSFGPDCAETPTVVSYGRYSGAKICFEEKIWYKQVIGRLRGDKFEKWHSLSVVQSHKC
jgi:hypothetical protein